MDLNLKLLDMVVSKNDYGLSDYAFYMWYLQENADLTYKEARVILRDLRNESIKDLCFAFDCKPQSIYNLQRKGLKKINDSIYYCN